MSKQKTKKLVLVALLSVTAVMLIGSLALRSLVGWSRARAVDLSRYAENFDDYTEQPGRAKYLSDTDVNPISHTVGWDTFRKDMTNASGSKISLYLGGQTVTFDRGLWAHASSRLSYDLEAIDPNHEYAYFSAYYGINTSSHSGDGVTFKIYVSNHSNSDWVLLKEQKKRPGEEASFAQVDIRGYRYLQLEANQDAGNGSDHSVWADAKLVTADFKQYLAPDTTKYDQEIQQNYSNTELQDNAAYELTVLRREFVSRVGQYTLSTFIGESPENRRALEWLFNDLQNLRWFILGGKPQGSYMNALKVFTTIYTNHHADFVDARPSGYGDLTYGDVYRKLATSLALTHSASVRAWYDSQEISNPLRRYEIYKDLYEANLLDRRTFTQLEIEEMRFVTGAIMGDDEIKWLNNHARDHRSGNSEYELNPYAYITYRFGYNYGASKYYTAENQSSWDEKYKLSQFGVPYGVTGKAKLWMVFEEGSVCGGLSKTGSNLWNVFGLPATVIGQPGHAAYLGMSMDDEGDGHWGIGNDVSGWTGSEKSERFLLGWGSSVLRKTYYNVSFFSLGQDALNDMDGYTLAEETLMQKDLHSGSQAELEALYRKAIGYQSFNLDAWVGLVQLHLNNPETPESTYVSLAREVATNFQNYPLPMYDLMSLLRAKITSAAGIAEFENAQRQSLLLAKDATNADTKQSHSTRVMANYLLGRNKYEMASFSFDGDNAKKIVLGSQYDGVLALQYQYSLDGGETWTDKTIDTTTVERNVTLTDVELSRITPENDIKVRIVGANDAIYTIDITKAAVPANLYANDQENRVMGVSLTMEWCEVTADDECNGDSANWTSYRNSSPQRVGDVSIRVRQSATGTRMTSDPSEVYHFTVDPEPDRKHTYIPVSHLSLARASSEALGSGRDGNAVHAIDGNFYTRWHSSWNGSDHERYIVIKFDRSVNLSRLDYVAGGGGNGHIMQADIYTSTSDTLSRDGFTLVGKLTDHCDGVADGVTCRAPWPNQRNDELANSVTHTFDFDTPVTDVKYVAIKANVTSDGANFVAARMFNFYEDREGIPDAPTANLVYDTRRYTRNDVLVRLVNPSIELTDIQVQDAAGNSLEVGAVTPTAERLDTTTLKVKENSEYTFIFTGVNGESGTVLAKVDWIDRESPVGHIEYDRGFNNPTNKSVTAKLIIDGNESVTVTNNSMSSDDAQSDTVVWDPFTYTFEDNGEFTFQFEDAAGNQGTATAQVTWIDHAAPKVAVKYDITTETDGEVVATLEKVSYDTGSAPVELRTFAAQDVATGKHYDAEGYEYDEDFIVTAHPDLVFNDGVAEYHFTKNGEFTFEYCDVAGNCANTVAKVDWIRNSEEPSQPTEPTNPDQPVTPSRPDPQPEEPSTPSDPSAPETPSDPARPSNPTTPGNHNSSRPNNNSANSSHNSSASNQIAENSADRTQSSDKNSDKDSSSSQKPTANSSKPSTSGNKDNSSTNSNKSQNDKTAQPWYQQPVVLWSAGGLAALAVIGIVTAMVKNRRR